MRDLGHDITTHLQSRAGLAKGLAIWTAGRDRDTNIVEHFGFWSGPEDINLNIDGQLRTYHGAGSLISIPPQQSQIGLNVRTTRIKLSPLHPQILQAIRGYDPRGLPVELHVIYFRPGGGDMIGAPVQVGYTQVAGLTITEPAPGQEASCELAVQSRAAYLAKPLHLRKSDAALQRRAPGDAFRRYVDVSGTVETVWGTKRSTGSS